MKSRRTAITFTFLAAVFCTAAHSQSAPPNKGPLDYANSLVGTAPLDNPKVIGNAPPPGEHLYSGLISPGAVLPHGTTQLGPINNNTDLNYPAGVRAPYYYPNRTLFGFSSGTDGGPIFMPTVGDFTIPPERPGSVYDKKKEKATPGYYSVYLDDTAIRAEMTVTTWTGIYRFTYPKSDKSTLLVDTGRTGGQVEIVGDHTVRGATVRVFSGAGTSRDRGVKTYFVAEFSRPFTSFGTFRQVPPQTFNANAAPQLGDKDVEIAARNVDGKYAGAFLRFNTSEGEQVMVKIAYGVSYEMAERRLQAENPGWNFEAVHKQAEAAWAKKLDQIEVSGGSEKEKMLFYSCLLHSFASPRLIAQKGEDFTGLDGKNYTADYNRYGLVPYWDTGRDQVLLLTLLEPETKVDILRSQFAMARESGFMGTSFHGDHAVMMYLGDWERGLKFDYAGVYEYLRKNATTAPDGPRRYNDQYLKQGWIADFIPPNNPSPPYAGGTAGAATTLEYSWDDSAMARYAAKLGKTDDAAMFLARAHNYKNVFDPTVGFMRGRTADGKFISPFDPGEPYYNFMMKEASGWSTLWLVPHDVQGLINLLGGREKFDAKLDAFFSTPYHPKGICRDCTGLIGQYVQGNQPDQQSAYYYDWGGQPWKTQKLARQILSEMYGSDKSGYAFPGMDDQGSTASWYVLSAMGFYTVDPASPNYILGSPLFNRMVLHMGNGKNFEVDARNNSAQNIYIQSATLNGKPWNKPWFSHADIANGGKLVLVMGATPNKSWGSAPEDAPPSMTPMN